MSAFDRHIQRVANRRLASPDALRAARIAVNFAIVAAWLWLYRPVYQHLSVVFTREDFRTNQLLLLGAIALIALRLHRERLRPRLDASPHLNVPALALMAGGSVAFLLIERFLDINIIATFLFGLASYGLLGLWMQPSAWRAGLPAALMVIGALPFGDFIQVFVGYPMRIITAALVRDGLAAAGVASVGIDTILVFENGVSQVDLPCSGVKSLWTGALFLMAATWIEGRAINLRWLMVAIAFGALLFLANFIRVAALVIIGQVMGWALLAEMMHVPLGVLAFVLACGVALLLLRSQPSLLRGQDSLEGESIKPRTLVLPAPALLAFVLVLNVLYAPRPSFAQPEATTVRWQFPPAFNAQPLTLRPGELDWLMRDGAESVERARFNWRGITGSMLLVTSTSWRPHHQPERCFENYGLMTESAQTHLVGADLPVRFLTLTNGTLHANDKEDERRSATYWFQSATRSTEDYGARLWSALSLQSERWVLVTVLFDRQLDPRMAEVQSLYVALHEVVQRQFENESENGSDAEALAGELPIHVRLKARHPI